MPNISEESKWESGVRQVETGDPVAGGPSGPVNLSLQDLANRTLYLKGLAESILADLNEVELLLGGTSMSDVLLRANNLSDIPNKTQARSNLGVAASDHTHGTYLSKVANLSDVDNPTTCKQNLGVLDVLFGAGVPALGTGKNGDVYFRTDLDYVSVYRKILGIWTLAATTTNIPGNAATATAATTAATCSGNSATADKLKTARKINGVSFDGSADVTVPPHAAIQVSANGYVRLQGSGLIIQWGMTASVGGDSYLDTTFPISFPNACFSCVGIIVAAVMHTVSEGALTVGNITKTGFRVVNGADKTGPFSFIAIGY